MGDAAVRMVKEGKVDAIACLGTFFPSLTLPFVIGDSLVRRQAGVDSSLKSTCITNHSASPAVPSVVKKQVTD
jgi:hypothetical protein